MPLSRRPAAILFDWDNTLVDTWVVIHHALRATFEAMEMTPWTLEETRQRVRQSARDAFPVLFGERVEAATRIFYETYERDHLDRLTTLPGVSEMLEQLAARDDLFLAVVSNKKGPILRREARHLGWDRIFKSLVGASDAERDKPARESIELALAESSVEPGPDVWFVGDTDIDMLCARNAGCKAVLLRPHPQEPEEFADSPPDIHLEGPASLCEALALSKL